MSYCTFVILCGQSLTGVPGVQTHTPVPAGQYCLPHLTVGEDLSAFLLLGGLYWRVPSSEVAAARRRFPSAKQLKINFLIDQYLVFCITMASSKFVPTRVRGMAPNSRLLAEFRNRNCIGLRETSSH